MKPHMKAEKSDPRLAGLQDLHSMLSDAIRGKMQYKLKEKKQDRTKAGAAEPDSQMGAEGEAADESDPQAKRRKLQFGAKGK